LLVSYDMGIWNKKTTLIKINNKEKGFIQVKETIQASHQQWNIKKIMIFFRSGESPWFTRPNVLLKKLQFRIHCHGQNTVMGCFLISYTHVIWNQQGEECIMGTKIFITIYIPNSFIVNILSLREGKFLSNYLLHQ
jgi:hypothetical protein